MKRDSTIQSQQFKKEPLLIHAVTELDVLGMLLKRSGQMHFYYAVHIKFMNKQNQSSVTETEEGSWGAVVLT